MRACGDCLRRSWLLERLSARLDYASHDRARLIELLALADEELIAAVAGRHREALGKEWKRFEPFVAPAEDVQALCRHDGDYPSSLASDGAPHMLHVAGRSERLTELARAPIVAIVGTGRATDYGMEITKSLARGLAASGITVVSELVDGIAVAAHAGALEVEGGTIAVMSGGLEGGCAARWRGLYRRVRARGCAVAELPSASPARRWGRTASRRIVAELAELTIVVEADENPGELLGATLAHSLGRTVAAVPGRVTSPVSTGTHRLLMDGAALVRRPEDVLELLGRAASPASRDPTHETDGPAAFARLEPRLRRTLEAVGAGRDTAAKLMTDETDAGETLLALSELELMGLLARGDGGRYVPRQSAVSGRGGA
ncbi:MAG TPA: DNA-processing protein DprA [Solirubrobacteraceae bacterium]